MSKKKARRRPFETLDETAVAPERSLSFDAPTSGLFRFFEDRGVRETVESVIVAIILAMMFRTFGAEAYIIPTGSMAPTLFGQHMDLHCEHCGVRYFTGSSEDNATIPKNDQLHVIRTSCPFCRSPMDMRPHLDPDHRSNEGDRIVVNKFIYDFDNPERFDVIVFKNPNNGKQNFIKRLVGLPNEQLVIENGDIFTVAEDGSRQIVRKPAHKLLAMMQTVDDTYYIASKLHDSQWPLRWNTWGHSGDSPWKTTLVEKKPKYQLSASGAEPVWLQYRHLLPDAEVWESIAEGKKFENRAKHPRGELITDYYTYNNRWLRGQGVTATSYERTCPGYHWVGDLGLQVNLEVKSNSGTLWLQVVEGGVRFQVAVDVATGVARLSNSGGYPFVDSTGQPTSGEITAETPLRGPGSYDVMFVNADDQLRLWVNEHLIEFPASCYLPARYVNPQWSEQDPGDAEPAGIAGAGVELLVDRLRIWRDNYYTSVKGFSEYNQANQNETLQDPNRLRDVITHPEKWNTAAGKAMFQMRFREGGPMFTLNEGQFLPMGDNSPESLDARIWEGEHFVPGELMIGRALYTFWPHPKNKPIPYFPNFERMGPIR